MLASIHRNSVYRTRISEIKYKFLQIDHSYHARPVSPAYPASLIDELLHQLVPIVGHVVDSVCVRGAPRMRKRLICCGHSDRIRKPDFKGGDHLHELAHERSKPKTKRVTLAQPRWSQPSKAAPRERVGHVGAPLTRGPSNGAPESHTPDSDAAAHTSRESIPAIIRVIDATT
jgi:hypothetical protein